MSVRPDLLARLDPTRATSTRQPGAVYLLPHVNRLRFKVGWSLHPMQRVRQLPEFQCKDIDLPAAQVAWFQQAQRAHQVERALHRSLAPFRADAGHLGDGRTEWFGIQGIVLARRMISLLPAADGQPCRSRLRPLEEAPNAGEEPITLPIEQSALDAWYRVEDLWLRLSTLLPLRLVTDREQRQLHWLGMKQLDSPGLTLLRSRALNLETYEWREEGQRRSLVRLMDWERNNLLLYLTPTRQLQRWAEGDAVDSFLRAFLARYTSSNRTLVPEVVATAGR